MTKFDPDRARAQIKAIANGDIHLGLITVWAVDMLVKEMELQFEMGRSAGLTEAKAMVERGGEG